MSENPTSGSPTSETTKKVAAPKAEVEVTVKTAKAESKGLAADAKLAKAQYSEQDKKQAAAHQELRDNDKIVAPTPLIAYETARQDLYLDEEDKTAPATEADKA